MSSKWIMKAFIQSAMSNVAWSEKLNYFFQTRISKSLPTTEKSLVEKAKMAITHFNYFNKHNTHSDLSRLNFFEFGAGWNLCVPIIYFMLGIDHQTIIDIEPHVRYNLLNDAIVKIEKRFNEIQDMADKPLRHLNLKTVSALSELKSDYGFKYLAPLDARNTALSENSFDFISNTLTLQHIPPPDLYLILIECYRILKEEGIVSCFIDLNDNYSYTDKSISRYNFMKFSEQAWRKYNPSLHYQNRLRYPEYVDIITKVGFKIIDQKLNHPNPETFEILKNFPIAEKFRKFSLEDLAITSFWIILQKQDT